jgi:hypothetical protein
MEVRVEFHAPAVIFPWKEPSIAIGNESGWGCRAGVDLVENRKIS